MGKTGLICGQSRELSVDDIKQITKNFAEAATNAIKAGFDGIEIHGANGYLVDQFLHYCVNKLTDKYGITPRNMARFCLEVVEACSNAIGFDKIGVRLSPGGHMNEIHTVKEDQETYKYLLNQLNECNIAYVHTGNFDDSKKYESLENMTMTAFLRTFYKGTIIASGNYGLECAKDGIQSNKFDLIAFGRLFIANPDLITPVRLNQLYQYPVAVEFLAG